MFKRTDGKKRRKSRSKRSKRCRSLLGKKIGINIHEGIYANKAQAIAVAYSQIRKRYPSCRRILRSKKSRKSKRRSIRRRSMDGAVQGTGENGYLTVEEQNAFKQLFTLYTEDQSNQKSNSINFQTFEFMDVDPFLDHWDIGSRSLNDVKVYIHVYTSWFTGDTTSTFRIKKSDNENVVGLEENIIGNISKITKYILA